MDFANDLHPLGNDLEKALTGLVKLIKALSFYPADHPSLAATAEEVCNDFQPLLKHHDPRPYHITKEGFKLDAEPLAPKNRNLAALALKLVERRVRHLLFLPELTNYELTIFAEELSKPAAQLLAEGGLEKRLADRQIQSIWINETNLEEILNKINPDTTPPSSAPAASFDQDQEQPASAEAIPLAPPVPQQNPNDQMRDLLEQLKNPQDDQTYQRLLHQVQQLAFRFFNETGIIGHLAVFSLLENHRKDSSRENSQQQAAEALIDQLLTEVTSKTLVDAVADQNLKASQHRALVRLMIGLGSKVSPQLLKRLYVERDAIIRRHYSDILAHMGDSTFELLKNDLQSETWHVVRNVVTILGKTRLEAAIPLLSQVIDHPEVRVRRTVIRALSAIGGTAVIPLLLRLTKDADEELHQPAIMTLGALKNPRAIPPLVELLKKHDLFGKQTKLKTAVIQALAATGSPQAIIPLLKQARRLNLLNRKGIETLRAEAILALGQLGNSQLVPVLEQLPRREKGPVSKALKQAKTQLRKQQHVA